MIQAAGVSAAGIAAAAIMACVDKNRIAICTFLGIVTAMLMVCASLVLPCTALCCKLANC